VLARVNLLAADLTALNVAADFPHARVELPLVVERVHDDVPSLVPLGVVAVVADDEAADAVIFRIDSRHGS